MNLYLIKTRLVKASLMAIALLAMLPNAVAQNDKPSVYKIAEAGVQVDLPPGWEVSKEADGTILMLKKDAGGYVIYSLSVLSRDPSVTLDAMFGAFSEGIFDKAKKDWKGFKAGEVIKDSQGGMALQGQKFDGSVADAGGELEGLVIVIDSPKPLGIFAQRTKKHSDVLEKESGDILASIKKIP